MDRRQLVQLAAASATCLWLPRSAWSQPRLGRHPFAAGIASGSPSHEGVVLWTRLMGGPGESLPAAVGPVTVAWEVADDEGFEYIRRRGQAPAVAELAHSVHAEVDGLEPDRWYFYRFMVGTEVSMVGRTRTLPAPDARVARLRLAYASCQRWEDGYFSAWRHLRADNPDLVLFLGDYLYEYPGTASRIRRATGGWVLTLDDYRRRYALYKSDPDLQAIHAACPWLLAWDDHEVQNDYAGSHAGNSGPNDPSSAADFAARRAAAYQAYYEHMPLRAAVLARALAALAQPLGSLRMYGRLDFGRLASLHLLDGRQYRDAQLCTRDGKAGSGTVNPATCAPWLDEGRSMLGMAQERWLNESLARPDTRERSWSVLGQQTLFGQRDFRPGAGQVFANDGWDGYARARTRLTDALRTHAVPNVVVLGGDIHANWVGQVKADYGRPDSAALGVEFCGTSITSQGGSNDPLPERLAENPHFVFADAQSRGYGIAEFTPTQLTTTLRAVDDVARRDSGISTLASFVVRAGRPVPERA